MHHLIKLSLGLLCLASCNVSSRSPQQYIEAIDDNQDLHKQIEMGDIVYTLSVLPPEYIAAKYAFSQGKFDAGQYKEKIGGIHKYIYSTVSMRTGQENILKYNVAEYADFQRRLAYFSDYAMQDIKLITDQKDTLMPLDYIYENNLGVSNENKMIMVFEMPVTAKQMSLIFNDRIFNNYNLRLNVSTAEIKALPSIKVP